MPRRRKEAERGIGRSLGTGEMEFGIAVTQLLAKGGSIFDSLGITWESIVLHLFNLIVLTVGLYFLLFRPVKKMIKQRQEKVKKIEKENADLNDEVKKMKSSSEKVLSDAKKEAAAIHESAVKVANQKADDIVAEARERAKTLVEQTQREMDEERSKLRSDIERQIADVSVAVAEKVIEKQITPEDNKALIEKCLDEWSKE